VYTSLGADDDMTGVTEMDDIWIPLQRCFCVFFLLVGVRLWTNQKYLYARYATPYQRFYYCYTL
jgi:hypothetical protein